MAGVKVPPIKIARAGGALSLPLHLSIPKLKASAPPIHVVAPKLNLSVHGNSKTSVKAPGADPYERSVGLDTSRETGVTRKLTRAYTASPARFLPRSHALKLNPPGKSK